jgi:hypothetical protein
VTRTALDVQRACEDVDEHVACMRLRSAAILVVAVSAVKVRLPAIHHDVNDRRFAQVEYELMLFANGSRRTNGTATDETQAWKSVQRGLEEYWMNAIAFALRELWDACKLNNTLVSFDALKVYLDAHSLQHRFGPADVPRGGGGPPTPNQPHTVKPRG